MDELDDSLETDVVLDVLTECVLLELSDDAVDVLDDESVLEVETL